MTLAVAKNCLLMFDDALYVENCFTGNKILREDLERCLRPEKAFRAHLTLPIILSIIAGMSLAFVGWACKLQFAFAVGFCIFCLGMYGMVLIFFACVTAEEEIDAS